MKTLLYLMKHPEFKRKTIFWFALWGSIPFIERFLFHHSQRKNKTIRVGGAILISSGILLNAIAGKTLKRQGHLNIKDGINTPEKVVDVGIYKCMKHPAQFGSGLVALVIGMLRGTVAGIFAGMTGLLVSLVFILNIEEPQTMTRFSDYCQKMGSKPGISLNLWCILKTLTEG